MLKIPFLTCALILFGCPSAICATSRAEKLLAVDASRTSQADQVLARIVSDKKELAHDEYFLVSFSTNITQNDMLATVGQQDAGLTALHVCDKTGGITAFTLDGGVLADQLDKVRREARVNANKVMLSIPSTDSAIPRKSRPDLNIPEDFKICGVEARTSLKSILSLKEKLSGRVRAIEITNRRFRKFPIHVAE